MKIKSGFVVRKVAGKSVAVAVGERSRDFRGVITLNETGRTLFDALQSETDIDALTALLTREYDVDEDTARTSALDFIGRVREAGLLE